MKKIEVLEDKGFTWQTQKHISFPWIDCYEELNQFNIKKGYCEVPKMYTSNPSLGRWVGNIRRKYKFMKDGKVS